MVDIKIYTKKTCPYCVKAKMLLKSLKVEFKEINVDNSEEQQKLIDKTGMMTVPQIFIDNKLIGGCDDLYALKDSGELKKLLNI